MSDVVAQLESDLRAARKYRHLAGETLRRVAAWAHDRHASPRDALKAAKRKLHQIFAAYCLPDHIDRLLGEVERLPPFAETEAHRTACRAILAQHASTSERLELLDTLYPALWEVTSRPRCVLDLACGYHPFALPWMGLDGAEYHACDIDQRLVAGVNAYLRCLGRPATAVCKDLLAGAPEIEADVVFVFKSVPCLEQQEKGSAVRLLRLLRARWAIVSFPLGSLGGRSKGMRETYGKICTDFASELRTRPVMIEFPNEVFCLFPLD